MTKLLTSREVATLYGVSKAYIVTLVKAGVIKGRQVGSAVNAPWIFDSADLPEFLPTFKRQEEG